MSKGTRWGRRAAVTFATGAVVAALCPVLPSLAAPVSAGAPSAGLLDEEWGDDDTGEDEKASRATGSWQADGDWGSVYNIAKFSGIHDTWGKTDPQGRKVTGRGVTVALIDTGVSPVAGLSTSGKIINGPDLSFESQNSTTRHLDGFGHGTHMAGIIAGRDASVTAGNENNAAHFVGVAPDARILNMKVATADGGNDVSQVIAAIDWVVQHRNDNGMNVRVINLSYGTDSRQPYQADPLAKAVENAWNAGIDVVVAAATDGGTAPLTMPAADPFVIAVGASDHRGTDAHVDDRITSFTNPGTTSRRPDLLAPGKSVVSLRVPGSVADLGHPEGLVTGDVQGRFFRGSGTSQSAAVVSGAVALLLQARPTMTPDQVKKLLKSSAEAMPVEPSPSRGAGQLDVKRALELATPSTTVARQSFTAGTGTGTLEASRGTSHVVDPQTGAVLRGEVDALGTRFDARAWAAASTARTAWSGGDWNGKRWSGATWSSAGWTSTTWTGASWTGGNWEGKRWSSATWSGKRWSGTDWSGSHWSGSNWEGKRWSTADHW